MTPFDSLVIGAGQAGLSASHHLRRLGIDHVVLDANEHAGGAWQHRWDSLTMADVHGVADLPDAAAPGDSHDRANEVIARWFDDYEQAHDLPVLRLVRVDRVTDVGGMLHVHAAQRTWVTRTLVNATGTWTHPFVPTYPGQRDFAGEQWHTVAYPGREHFRGMRVLVVGGGASAVQFIGELATIAEITWVTRRPPVWTDEFSGRRAIELVEERVREGRPPASVVSVTGCRCGRRRWPQPAPGSTSGGGRSSIGSSVTGCAGPTAASSRPTRSCGRPDFAPRCATWHPSACAASTAASRCCPDHATSRPP